MNLSGAKRPLFTEMMRQRRKGKRLIATFGTALLLFVMQVGLMTGCGSSRKTETAATSEDTVTIYYLAKDEKSLNPVPYQPAKQGNEARVEELLQKLSTNDSVEYKAPITGFTLLGYTIDNGVLTLDFPAKYKKLGTARETLTRAAIVCTLGQVTGISGVRFTVDGKDLLDADGKAVGVMTSDSFVLNIGKDIGSYEKVRLHLYFANEEGNKLIGVYRTVVYNSNISMDKMVVEELLKGPNGQSIYPAINPETRIISVTSKDGVCYVNFDKAFLTEPYAVRPEVAIYSLVDSLTELPGISKVQISIDGDTTASFLEQIPLQTVFERDLSFVDNPS